MTLKKFIFIILLIYPLIANSQSQLVNCIPDTGRQSFSYPFRLNGTGTEWTVSPYFEIYFWGGGVFADSVRALNDSVILAWINVEANADTGFKTVILADAFLNYDSIPQGYKVFLWFPAKPVLLYPFNNSQNILQNTIILWDSNKTVDNFRLQIANDSLFNSIAFDTVVAQPPVNMRLGILQLGQKYFWRVRASNILGFGPWSDIWNFRIKTTGIEQIGSNIPDSFVLEQNFPNPFNPVTTINFQIPKAANVVIKVFDINGREIETLVNKYLQPGYYKTNFAPGEKNLSSGVYFYTMQSDDFYVTKKMVVLK